MTRIFAPVAALLLSTGLLLTGNGLQGTLLPVRAQIEAFSTFSIGFLGSTYFAGFAAGCLLGPWLVRRVGHIRTFAAMAAIASATPLGHALAIHPLPWWGFRIVNGFCIAVLFVVIESWLNERATQGNRGTILATYLFINMTVMMIGQMMMTLYPPDSLALFALVSILVSLAAVPVALSSAPAPAPVERARVRIGRLYQLSPVGALGCVAVGLVNGSFWSLAPLFAQLNGFATRDIAVFMSATVLGGALSQWPIGRLSDKVDRRKVIIVVCFLSVVVSVGIALASVWNDRWLLVLAGIWGFFTFPIYSLAVAHANDHASPKEFVEVSSSVLLAYGAGAVSGPIIASALMNASESFALYGFAATIHGTLAAFTMWRMRRRDPAPPELHGHFVDALEATQTVSQVFDEHTQQTRVREAAAPAPSGSADAGRS